MAEQLALQQVLGNGGRVDGHERPARPRTVTVQGQRHQLLAGAAGAGDEHRAFTLAEPSDGAKHLLHGRRLAQHQGLLIAVVGVRLIAQAVVFGGAANQFDRAVDVEGFWQVLEGAAAKRAHRAVEVAVGGHDDDRQLGVAALGFGQQLDAAAARHADVGHQHLGLDPRIELVEHVLRSAEAAHG